MKQKLVINGKEIADTTVVAVNFDGDRVPLPARFTEQSKLQGNSPIYCWLLVVTAGRYRLIVKPDTGPESDFARLLRAWEATMAAGDVLDRIESNDLAGIYARLIPTVAAPMGTGWRITIPKEAKLLVPVGEDRTFVFVTQVAGFVEFWFPDTLRRAVSKPIVDLLP